MSVVTKAELVSYGYVREFVNTELRMESYIVPKEIYCLIFAFHGGDDYIDKHALGKYHKLERNQLIVHEAEGNENYKWSTSLFYRSVSTGKHRWTFKIYHVRHHVLLGIWDAARSPIPTQELFTKKKAGYAYNVGWAYFWSGEDYTEYGIQCESGDIVTMSVNFEELTLHFSVNDESCGRSHKIKPGSYKAAICTIKHEDSVEFIEYQ